MTIKTIFWDIGGVLERTEDPAPRAALADQLGWPVSELSRVIFGHVDDYRIQRGLITLEEHYANLAEALEIPTSRVDSVLDAFFGGDRLDLALVDHIRALRQEYTTAVISNYMPVLRDKITNLWQIGDAFDVLVVSSEVGVMKPDPEIYRIALEKTSTPPGQGVFIDDFIENVEGARRAGMRAIHFKAAPQALEDLHDLLDKHRGNH
jgi:epoxide hydrolase-like predicted phosphatase